MATKATPTLSTIEGLLDEVDEWYGRVSKIRRKLRRLPRGSEAYLNLLPDLWVELDWLKMKAETAAEALDEFEESLPEND